MSANENEKIDESIHLIVACALTFTTIFSVIGIIVLSILTKEIPSALVALGSVAVGALGSLFTHTK